MAPDIFLIGAGGVPIFPDMFSNLSDSYGSSVGSTLTVGWLTILHLFFLFFHLCCAPLREESWMSQLPVSRVVEKWTHFRGSDISSLLLCAWPLGL